MYHETNKALLYVTECFEVLIIAAVTFWNKTLLHWNFNYVYFVQLILEKKIIFLRKTITVKIINNIRGKSIYFCIIFLWYFLVKINQQELTLFRKENQKGPPTNFSPVATKNVGISLPNFLTFSFNPFATQV